MAKRIPAGTQSIVRTVQLLKALGARRQIGWRVTDLAAHCGLTTSTAYRIMTCLTGLRLARQRTHDKRYVPGPVLYELALNVPAYFRFQAACRQYLERIHTETGWVVFLALRSGDETVCIDRVGTTSVNIMNDVGRRLPLAGSALGCAILLALPHREQERIWRANRRTLLQNKAHRDRPYDEMWRRSQALGLGLNLGDILPGGASMSAPILDHGERPVAAVSVAGPLPEFTDARIGAVGQLLRDTVARIRREHADIIAEIELG